MAYLVTMGSREDDTVLDPFLGIGTTMYAAMTAGRNSIGFELDKDLRDSIRSRLDTIIFYSNELINNRLSSHLSFLNETSSCGNLHAASSPSLPNILRG